MHGEDLIDRDTEIGGSQALIAFEKQSCSDEKNYGETYFQHQQNLSEASTRVTAAVSAG